MVKTFEDSEFNNLVGLLGKITGKRNREIMAEVMNLLEKVEMREDF